MAVIFRIAIRNLREHKAKTLIIGIIIGLGIAILVIGNSMMETASRGIEKSFTENFSGHIMISGRTDYTLSLFGLQNPSSINEIIPVIPEYTRVLEYVRSHPHVEKVTSQITGRAMISFEDKGNTIVLLFGIDPESYRNMFPDNIEILDGELLKTGEEGILLSEKTVREIKDDTKTSVRVGDSIIIHNIPGPAGMKIREVPVKGIFRFIYSNEMLDRTNLIDMENHRVLSAMTVGYSSEIELDDADTALLNFESQDSIFEGDTGDMMEESDIESKTVSEESLLDILGDTSERTRLSQTDSGSWHFLLVKLKNPSSIKRVMSDINIYFEKEGIPAQTADWSTSAGMMAGLALSVQSIFNIIILIIAVVAVIIIMNTLVISITERTSEIGTMRAIGAHKGFIRKMIILETLVISFIFGTSGIIFGSIILIILNLTGIPAANFFLEIIFGGKVLHPALSIISVAQSLLIIFAIGILASMYPIAVALKIQPIRAIQKA